MIYMAPDLEKLTGTPAYIPFDEKDAALYATYRHALKNEELALRHVNDVHVACAADDAGCIESSGVGPDLEIARKKTQEALRDWETYVPTLAEMDTDEGAEMPDSAEYVAEEDAFSEGILLSPAYKVLRDALGEEEVAFEELNNLFVLHDAETAERLAKERGYEARLEEARARVDHATKLYMQESPVFEEGKEG